MATQIHVARIALMPVNSVGAVVSKNSATIGQMMNVTSEERMISDSSIPNTANNPTPKAYLELEAAGDFILNHIDQTYIITYSK
jgi:hypothetical protein